MHLVLALKSSQCTQFKARLLSIGSHGSQINSIWIIIIVLEHFVEIVHTLQQLGGFARVDRRLNVGQLLVQVQRANTDNEWLRLDERYVGKHAYPLVDMHFDRFKMSHQLLRPTW